MSQKRIKRIKDTNKEYENALFSSIQQEIVEQRPDEDLFVIDTHGSKSKRRKISKTIENEKSNAGVVSKVEKKLIERIIKSEKADSKVLRPTNNSKSLHDLWTSDEASNHQSDSSKIVKYKKVSKPESGQSYNPLFEDHQNILAKGLAIEIKRREEEAKKQIPFSQPAQLALTNQSEENDVLNDEDESDSESENEQVKKPKMKERLTRAERNKQKAKNEAKHLKHLQDIQSKLLKSANKIPTLLREIKKKEATSLTKKELQKLRKQQAAAEALLIPTDPTQIPLSDELSGSLRQIIPKGVAVKVQALEMTAKGLTMAKDRRTRRKREKPHGAKKVVWIPKYKYV